MKTRKYKLFSLLAVVLILSATCSGFLVGRTTKLHEEGKLNQLQQMSERVVSTATVLHRGVEVIKRVILR